MVFSMPIHQDPHVTILIVDETWAAETLPVDDINVPANAIANVDDDDPSAQNEDGNENKWNDLGLDDLHIATSLNSAPRYIAHPTTGPATPHGR